MADEQYLTEKHYVVCDKGIAPKQLKVTSQSFVFKSGFLAATEEDTLKDNNFICVGSTAFAAGAIAGIACCCIPGPGWVVAAIIAVAILAAVAVGYIKCKSAAATRKWTLQSPVVTIQDKKALLLSSIMICPQEGGTITPKETAWAAWGSAALTNLGHVANFAFGFLAGRGAGAIAGEGIAAGAAVEGGGMAAVRAGLQTAGRSFLNTAKREMLEQFTFKGFMKAPTFCKIMRGLGIGGAYYDQYKIWSSDDSIEDKLKDSSVSLILGIFAGKGATEVCFPAGTKVHTEKGLVNIEDLLAGDVVLTYNEGTGEQEYKPILVKHERFTRQMLVLELPTGEFLHVTPAHRFYHNGEWIEARSLRPGDLLHLKNGDYTCIVSTAILPDYQKVYNFDVQDNENYYVTEDGILVHNGYDLDNKPKNSPDPKKWEAKGGLIEELEDGTWRYTDWEGNVVDYKNGHPDFSNYSRQDVDIGKQAGNHTTDYTDAVKKSELKPPKLSNDETTWHHHEDGKTMQEVDKTIHKRFTHNGGVSASKKVAFGKK